MPVHQFAQVAQDRPGKRLRRLDVPIHPGIGLYLEDLYIRPAFRGCGYGRRVMQRLAQIALERDCGRFEWWVLDWNSPAIEFYRSLGAQPMSDRTVQRVSGEALVALAAEPPS